nr:MAG TPA: hypothetical protein [Caudoviricetes sp.]
MRSGPRIPSRSKTATISCPSWFPPRDNRHAALHQKAPAGGRSSYRMEPPVPASG